MCEGKKIEINETASLVVLALRKMISDGIIKKNVWFDLLGFIRSIAGKNGNNEKDILAIASAIDELIKEGIIEADGDEHYLGSSKPLANRIRFI